MTVTDVREAAAPAVRKDTEWPLVTLAVLAYNRRDAVRVTLTKMLRELDYPALEAIVVDNASSDGTASMIEAEFPGVRVLRRTENIGVAALNEAFAQARSPWVLLLDDDCYLEGDGLKRAVAAAEAQAADLVSFRVRSSFDRDWYFNDLYPLGLLAFWGCSALVSGRALRQLGGFDPNIFIWANEVEFTIRLLDQGWRHLYLPDVVSVHMKPPLPLGEPFDSPRAFRLNYTHWAYTAGKLLAPRDAVRVLGRLLAVVALEARARSPEAARVLPGMLAAFGRGLGARQPVRPEVSALYRDNFASFGSPFEVVRRPAERLRARGDAAGVERQRRARWDRLFSARRTFYPDHAAVLEL